MAAEGKDKTVVPVAEVDPKELYYRVWWTDDLSPDQWKTALEKKAKRKKLYVSRWESKAGEPGVVTPEMEALFRDELLKFELKLDVDEATDIWKKAVTKDQSLPDFIPVPQFEVFQFIVNSKGKTPINLFARIILNDRSLLYNREENDYESILPGQCATLIGRPCTLTRRLSLQVELVDEASREGVQGCFKLDTLLDDYVQDLPTEERFTGNTFSVTFKYAVLNCALLAKVKVKLIKFHHGDHKPTDANVFGSIFCGIDMFDKSPHSYIESPNRITTTLLKDSTQEYTKVSPSERIILSRKYVAVPMSSSLKVYADLTSYNHGDIADSEIARGVAEFSPRDIYLECYDADDAEFSKKISGEYGEIEVTVIFT